MSPPPPPAPVRHAAKPLAAWPHVPSLTPVSLPPPPAPVHRAAKPLAGPHMPLVGVSHQVLVVLVIRFCWYVLVIRFWWGLSAPSPPCRHVCRLPACLQGGDSGRVGDTRRHAADLSPEHRQQVHPSTPWGAAHHAQGAELLRHQPK